MSTSYARHFNIRSTPQSAPIPGKMMVPNSAGGFTFKIDKWSQLDRFLVLGCEGNTYYSSEKKLTVENAQNVLECIKEDGVKTVNRILEISQAGRAPKNDPAVFALAMCAGLGSAPTKERVCEVLPLVARTGTMLFQFAEAVQGFRGWGRGLRSAIGSWYNYMAEGGVNEPSNLAYQLVKYQQRNGWSHRDLLRLSHPKASGDVQELFHWAVKGWPSVGEEPHANKNLKMIWAFERAKKATDKKEICKLIREYNLPRECIPTNFLNEVSVWEALLERMPIEAMVRNLGKMTNIGLLSTLSVGVNKVVSELSNEEKIRKSRLHPVKVLGALLTYKQGHGEKGKLTWNPVAKVVDALDGAFYRAFGNVEPTNKRWLLALDVSGSMQSGRIAGFPGLTPRVGSAAMALVTAAVEPQHAFVAFTSNGWQCSSCGPSQWAAHGMHNSISEVTISPKQRLDDVCNQISKLPMGGTDCALPMLWASENKVPVDCFVIYTDNETWQNPVIHASQALVQYREKMGIGAKMVVVGMTSTEFSLADPSDSGQMDVVGFDTNVPQIMSEFVKGN